MIKEIKTILTLAGIAGLGAVLFYEVVFKTLDTSAETLKETPTLLFVVIILILIATTAIAFTLIKLHARQKSAEHEIQEIKEELYPYEYELSGMTIEMFEEGSFEITVEQHIISNKNNLEKIEEKVNLSGESAFDETTVEVWGEALGHSISHRVCTNSKQLKLCNVSFSPSLEKSEEAHYFIRYKNKGGFLMTKDEILKQIEQEQWPFLEPYEYTSFRVRCPAKRVYFKLVFPVNFIPAGSEFFDICFDHSYERFPIGYESFKKKGKFKNYKDDKGRVVFELSDPSPTTGNNYLFKWHPPSKKSSNTYQAPGRQE